MKTPIPILFTSHLKTFLFAFSTVSLVSFCSIETIAQPVAKFAFSQSSTCVKSGDAVVVGFRDESLGGTHSTDWAFGDGGTSTNANPTWTYTAAGVYYVTLTIKDEANDISSITQQVVIFPSLDVKITSDVFKGCLPLNVVLTDLTKDLEIRDPISGVVYKEKISSRQWSMGDGSFRTSESSTITYTYTKPGFKDIGLTVLTEGGCSVYKASPKNFINVFPPAAADFFLPPPNTCQYPVTIQSVNTSSNSVQYKWSATGPTPVTISNNTEVNPSFTFQQTGLYKIKLTATSDSGCIDETTLDYFLPQTDITASFSSADSACANGNILFTNTSFPDPIDNKWFVDGVQVGSQKDLTYLFSTAGRYQVKLEVQIGACKAFSQKSILIFSAPNVDFSTAATESCSIPFVADFTDKTPGVQSKRIWEFGDGATLTQNYPYPSTVSHTYGREGLFSVKLTVVNSKNCPSSKLLQNIISIETPRVLSANMPDSGCVPFEVTPGVRMAKESEIATWNWEYTNLKGDVLFTTSGPSPAPYTFTDSGKYLVKLKITTIRGCEKDFSWSVKAGYVPDDFDFSVTPPDDCASTTFKFAYQGVPQTGYKWFFNNADSTIEKDPMKKFKKLGPVNVKLIVYQYGCKKELIKNNFVNVRGVITKFSALDDCLSPLERIVVDNSIGNIQQWDISFGDGNAVSYQSKRDSVKHSYAKSGQYTITMKVAGDNCEYIDSVRVNVSNERNLDFNPAKMPVCLADTFMTLNAITDKPQLIKSYNWDLGCGFTGAGTSGTLKVNLSSLCKYQTNAGRGPYQMQLRIIDTNNCVITSPLKTIFVGGPLTNYTAITGISGCKDLPVNFRDNSSLDGVTPVVSRLWDFGDGSTPVNILTGPVSHVFSGIGSFTVKLTLTDSMGCSSSKSNIVIRTSDPDIDFVALDTASCLEKDIKLESKSSAQLVSFLWNLDEGLTSNSPSPIVKYSVIGRKNISLTVKDLLGCERSVSKSKYINIDMPTSVIGAEKEVAECPPFNAGFTFQGSYAESFEWEFGDGATSTLKDPRHIYLESGVFPVTLTATSPGGCIAKSSIPLTIKVNGPRGTVSYSPTICEPFDAKFNITHTNTNFVFLDYGDGNVSDTLKVANQFSYVYKDTGLYSPKVFLLNDAGCRVLLKSPGTIRTISLEPKFTPNINFMCDNGTVEFTDRTYGNEVLTNWVWDFGDGKTGVGSKTTNFYARPGFYSVKLKVGSKSGCYDSLTRTSIIEVQARPDIGIISNKSVICEDDVIQFQAVEVTTNNSPVVSWFWDFTNGNSSSLQNPSLQPFRKAGVYPFRLYVTNSKGCSDTLAQNFVVNANPVLDAGADINLCLGSPVQLSPQGAVTYQWEPGPAISCLGCARPFVNPIRDTVYRVKGFSAVGCTAVDSVLVKVIQPSTVTAIKDTFVCEGESVQLFASGTALYNWTPAAGLSKTDIASPVARPTQTTTYKVTGKDPYSCFVTTDDVVVRYVPKPKVDAGKDTTVMAGYPFALRPSYSNDVSRVQWIPSLFMSCTDCKFPRSTPSYSATYTLFAYTDEGCMSKDVVNVFVTCTKENLYIPNTFSPNGDGMNEVFYPRGRGIEKIKSMKIFSRWGQLLYEKTNFLANDVSAGWNGKKTGQLVTPDVYVYLIELVCENGNIITWKGDVTLVR